jgi:hypothetical protein
MFNKDEYSKIINVPITVIIASFIIIILTTGITDTNGLSALIGGYMGLLIGVLFVVILNMPPTSWLDLFPFVVIMIIISIIIYYLFTYFEQISSGEVSDYYKTFSTISTIFLAIQLGIIYSAMLNNLKETTGKMLSNTTFVSLNLIGVLNFLVVATIGIVLRFYSTQG